MGVKGHTPPIAILWLPTGQAHLLFGPSSLRHLLPRPLAHAQHPLPRHQDLAPPPPGSALRHPHRTTDPRAVAGAAERGRPRRGRGGATRRAAAAPVPAEGRSEDQVWGEWLVAARTKPSPHPNPHAILVPAMRPRCDSIPRILPPSYYLAPRHSAAPAIYNALLFHRPPSFPLSYYTTSAPF
eukprot:scaffold9816_cov141-Isochrysis_galbana.AAC.3